MGIANSTLIQVWVQGEKGGGQWLFDDGTPIPDVCPISIINGPTEVHFRARINTSVTCIDDVNEAQDHFSCQYRRLLTFNN